MSGPSSRVPFIPTPVLVLPRAFGVPRSERFLSTLRGEKTVVIAGFFFVAFVAFVIVIDDAHITPVA